MGCSAVGVDWRVLAEYVEQGGEHVQVRPVGSVLQTVWVPHPQDVLITHAAALRTARQRYVHLFDRSFVLTAAVLFLSHFFVALNDFNVFAVMSL